LGVKRKKKKKKKEEEKRKSIYLSHVKVTGRGNDID
jgi:hypothetical protein